MKLILHIGTEKTGTTSSQKWANKNRKNLINQGVFYSKVLGSTSHVKIYLWALPPEKYDHGFSDIGNSTQDDRLQFQAVLPNILSQEVKEAKRLGCHTFLISNEHCHSRLLNESDIRKLHGLLEPLFESIRVLCSFRPQVDLAVSFSSTVSRSFFRVGSSFFEAVTPKKLYYNYDALEQRWAAVFGPQALDFFAFKAEPDTVNALTARLGLDVTNFNTIPASNEALDIQTISLMNAFVDMPFKPEGSFKQAIRTHMLDYKGGEKLRIDLDLAKKIHARFVESNAVFAARCPSISIENLTPDWARFGVESNLHLLDHNCNFSNQLGEVMMRLNAYDISTKIALELAKTERDLALCKPESADKFCTTAENLLHKFPETLPTNSADFKNLISRLRKDIARQKHDRASGTAP